jgi:glycosyltransferase involved in cell wall biosynthesis
MKIVVFGTRGFPNVQGGVEKHCENLYPRLVKIGCEVTVFGREPYLKIASSSFDTLRAPRNDTEGMAPCDDTVGWRLVIVGDADHEDAYSLELKRKAKEDSRIVLTGFLSGEPLQELYRNAGLFVLPSYYEGLPIVLLEAMSYGLSCVVSDIPAHREVELSEERYFKAGDVEGLASKLRQFMGKPLSAEEKNAQVKLVAERYDWGKIAMETLRVYEGVVSAQGTRA